MIGVFSHRLAGVGHEPVSRPVSGRSSPTIGVFSWATLAVAACTTLALVLAGPAAAQDDVRAIGPNTQVRAVDFVGNETFDDGRLSREIATAAPGLLDRIAFWRTRRYPFRPIELQKDVARLRRFYGRNGFLHARIDYVVSFDQSANTIRVVFTVQEGPPLVVADVRFVGPEGDRAAYYQFGPEERSEWVQMRSTFLEETGRRFEDFYLQQVESRVRSWVANRGFAFPEIRIDTSITHFHGPDEPMAAEDAVDVRVSVDVGPRSTFSEIQISGNQSISRELILKTIPVEIGEPFSQDDLVESQRRLFAMNLFRMAIADLPPQERDTSVAVRIRLREAEPRYLSAQSGYSLSQGVNLQGQWTHRNLFGNARSLTLAGLWRTGFGAIRHQNVTVPRRWRLSTSLRQPYFLYSGLSLVVSPFFERRFEQAYQIEQFGLNTTLFYDFHRFRTISLRHSLTRNLQLNVVDTVAGAFYNKSILNLSGTFGRADDYLNPTDGFLIQPYLELAGQVLASDVNYAKGGLEVSWYRPITEEIGTAVRLFAGQLEPLESVRGVIDSLRFRDVRFYAGGPADVRGWDAQLLGPKRPHPDGSRYVPLGGKAKLSGNLELRLPFPGLSDSWGTTAFVDFGQIRENAPSLDPGTFRYGAGAGIRYQTAVGPFRLDVAYKLNPDRFDVRPPFAPGTPIPASSFWRRTALYVTIGNPF